MVVCVSFGAFFFECYGDHRDLHVLTHSFPTRRSSDLLAALRRRAEEHKFTLCVGRSHGIHAEPTTFGLKLAGHYAEFARNRARLAAARAEIATCAISGPVGTFPSIAPAVERHVAEKMGRNVAPVYTQNLPLDGHATFFSVLCVFAGSCATQALHIRPFP